MITRKEKSMNFNIKREKNQIIVCVKLDPKKMLGDKRIRVGMPTVLDLIKDNFTFGKNESLGSCIKLAGLDNSDSQRCCGEWIFTINKPQEIKSKPIKQAKAIATQQPTKLKSKVSK